MPSLPETTSEERYYTVSYSDIVRLRFNPVAPVFILLCTRERNSRLIPSGSTKNFLRHVCGLSPFTLCAVSRRTSVQFFTNGGVTPSPASLVATGSNLCWSLKSGLRSGQATISFINPFYWPSELINRQGHRSRIDTLLF